MEQQYHNYLIEYYHNNAWWGLRIPATSEEDLLERLRKLPLAKILGIVEGSIPAHAGAGIFVRALCWWHNHFPSKEKTANANQAD